MCAVSDAESLAVSDSGSEPARSGTTGMLLRIQERFLQWRVPCGAVGARVARDLT